MNKYLRAIGFSKSPKRSEICTLIEHGIVHPSHRAYTTNENEDDALLAQFEIEFGRNFGLAVCGQFDENDQFFPDYVYPYLNSEEISTSEELSVESRVDNDSFAGVCDDLRVGVTLIFRVRNAIEYRKNVHTSFEPLAGASVSLTALSLEGTVLLPIYKSEADLRKKAASEEQRIKWINAAKNGDDSASRNLTMQDMDVYASVLSHLQYEDVYSIVDSYLMPYGAECELYSILGEIRKVDRRKNRQTDENVVVLTVDCNGLQMDIAINEKDLYGEPEAGRRFRGVIWLQGRIQFQQPQGGSSCVG